MFLAFLKRQKKCSHKNFSPFSGGEFCPDCGKQIEISWLLLRCKCCNSKRKAGVAFNSIIPQDKFCVKCGESKCYVEKKENPEFFDIEYAVISKRETDNALKEVLQIWIENYVEPEHRHGNLKFIPLLR